MILNEKKSLENILKKIPEKFNSEKEFDEFVNEIYNEFIKEASTSGAISGYQLPIGFGRSEEKRLINPYKTKDNKKIDDDEKIRNELATTDKINYIKKHPINKIKNILEK